MKSSPKPISPFRFRQFDVQHARSSMKVGTDAVVLGAWADTSLARQVLDVGTGCGVVALMMAQRLDDGLVVGIDIHEPSIEEATEKARLSPFADSVRFSQVDLRLFCPREFFHEGEPLHIISNPPYHEEDLLPPDTARSAARHTRHLPFDDLLSESMRIFSELSVPPDGCLLSVIIPTQAVERFLSLAAHHTLYPSRRTDIVTVPGRPPKRTLLELRPLTVQPDTDILVLNTPDGQRTPQYAHLCRDFYL